MRGPDHLESLVNTLPREITRRFFAEEDGFQRLQAHWRALVNSPARHELTAAHFLLYQALRGKDWRRAFGPVSNARKLANGYVWGRDVALRVLPSSWRRDRLLAPFAGLVTSEAVDQLVALLPSGRAEEAAGAYRTEEGARAA